MPHALANWAGQRKVPPAFRLTRFQAARGSFILRNLSFLSILSGEYELRAGLSATWTFDRQETRVRGLSRRGRRRRAMEPLRLPTEALARSRTLREFGGLWIAVWNDQIIAAAP